MPNLNLYIIKLYKNSYKVLYPVWVGDLDIPYIKLYLDRRFGKYPLYTQILPYAVVWIPRKNTNNVYQSASKNPSIRRTELL